MRAQISHTHGSAQRVDNKRGPHEAFGRVRIERRAARQDVRRRVHMRAGMGVHSDTVLEKAVALQRGGALHGGRRGAGIHRHAGRDGMREVDDRHRSSAPALRSNAARRASIRSRLTPRSERPTREAERK